MIGPGIFEGVLKGRGDNLELNKAQEQAIEFFNGACMVLAGPGSGKTTVITHRTKELIEKYNVNPSNILVITFTKLAASQMKERFEKITGEKRYPVSFGTFHAVFFKILKYAYNFSAENILREEVKYEILREIIESQELELDDEKEFISDIISEISNVKSEMIQVENYYSKNCGEDVFKNIYKKYNDALIRKNLLDFDDMLVMCYELFTQRPDILKLWQDKYKYILVDEFQDINRVQYEVLKLLSKPEDNIFIVGDDDQSIYRFRGAKPEIMLNFPGDYKNVQTIRLDVNYRCTGNIVAAASKVIKMNENRYKKTIVTPNGAGEPVVIRKHKTTKEEGISVLKIINEHIKNGGSYKDIAVLYRTSNNPRHLIGKLMEYNIPFKMKDTLPNIYEHFIAKNIISYINIVRGSMARADFLQIINRPKRYISRQAFPKPEVSFFELRRFYQDKEYVIEKLDKLQYDIKMMSRMNPYAAINYIRHAVGYEKYLEEYAEYRRINVDELYDVLDELTEDARNYKTYDEWFDHIEKYGEELKKQAKTRMENKEAVELSTMHSAKGLEYDIVIIIDANEGIIPHKKAVLKSDIEEERRMFYVALTRARKKLYVFYCEDKYGKELDVSRFVEELG